jgi:hypothetical protein
MKTALRFIQEFEVRRHRHDVLAFFEALADLEIPKVPVSWVYGHTRKRSIDPLPGYRLGKYWRFREDEVLAWVQPQRTDREAA